MVNFEPLRESIPWSGKSPDYNVEHRNIIECILKPLTDIEQRIIIMRFYDEYTLEETGRIVSLTRGRICQIEAHALRKIRRYLRADFCISGEIQGVVN